MKRILRLGIAGVILFTAFPAAADPILGVNDTGAVKLGAAVVACDATMKGAIRYTDAATDTVDLCDGVTWTAVGGLPAGANTQVQFNNSGAFGASANFTYDGTTLAVTSTTASTNGMLRGDSTAASGTSYGVVGLTNSTAGTGVYGDAGAATGTNYGVRGLSSSTSGIGVYGGAIATTGTTYGLWGQTASSSGRGVFGYASNVSGTTYGVYGQSASASGYGVFADVTPSTGTTYGVYGRSQSSAGYGGYFTNNGGGYALGVGGSMSGSPTLNGHYLYIGGPSFVFTDNATAASGTAANSAINSITQVTFGAANTAVTTTNGYSLYLAGAPIKGTNNTVTNAIALGIGAGAVGAQTNSYGLYVNAQTGATNNYAAAFMGGNVGIGVTAPTEALHVENNIRAQRLLLDSNSVSTTSDISLTANALIETDDNMYFSMDSDNTATTNAFIFGHDAAGTTGLGELMRIQENGRVGIGTVAPSAILDVVGDAEINGNLTITGTCTGCATGGAIYRGALASGDFNTLTGYGWYRINDINTGFTNQPTGVYAWGYLIVQNDGSNYTLQEYVSHQNGDRAWRRQWAGTWTAWSYDYNSDNEQTTIAGNSIWHAGNDGSGSTLDADTLDGYNPTAYNVFTGNAIVTRHASGYIYSNYFNMTAGTVTAVPTNIPVETGSDKFLRWQTPAQLISNLGIWTSGNDGSGSTLDADTLDGVDGSNYTRADLTFLGKTGNIGLDTVTDTAAEWSNLPIGYSRMFSNTIGTAGGAPVNNYGYFSKTANRDSAGGWGGFWAGYTAGQNYVGRASTNAVLAQWDLLWSDANDGSGSGLDADLLDGLNSSVFLTSETDPLSFKLASSNAADLRFAAANGRGMRFWDSDSYKIWMSASADATWGGRLDSTSDYNMYFRMTAGTNRGFVFKNNTTNLAQIDGAGNFYNIGNTNIGGNLTITGTCTGCGGSPAGADTQVQYNNSGAFGASANFTYDGTTLTVTSATATNFGMLHGNSTAASGFSYGIFGESASPAGIGVYGRGSGGAIGVQGNSTSGTGVFGSGATYGVYGQSSSTSGRGVYGTSASTSGYGVRGEASAATGSTHGGYFQSNSTSGRGVYGTATAATGTTYGGYFTNPSTSGFGVFGYASAATGTTYGVYGTAASASGYGGYFTNTNGGTAIYATSASSARTLYAENTNTGSSTAGVYGSSASTSAVAGSNAGVFGIATASTGRSSGVRGQGNGDLGYGVYGTATAATGTNYGVYGTSASAAGYGGYFTNTGGGTALYVSGDLTVTGTCTGCGGGGSIDSLSDAITSYGTDLSMYLGQGVGASASGAQQNVALGMDAAAALTTGDRDTFVGYQAGTSNTTAVDNTFIGYRAGASVVGGHNNTAIGSLAFENYVPNVAFNYNVAVGYQALRGAGVSSTGERNTALGSYALKANTSGADSVAIGYGALDANTTGAYNTAVGDAALGINAAGSYNTAVGYNAASAMSGFSNTTAVGYAAAITASNSVRIGNTSVTLISGQVAWTFPSDRRDKHDIQDSDLGLNFIMKLRPVSYRLNNGNGLLDYGFIAQEVEQALEDRKTNMITIQPDERKSYLFRSSDMISPLVKAVQEQQAQIEGQQAQILELKAANDNLKVERDAAVEDRAAIRAEIGELRRAVLALQKAGEDGAAKRNIGARGADCSSDVGGGRLIRISAQEGGEQGCCAAFAYYSQSIDARIDAAVSENDVLRAQLDELKEHSGYPETWHQRLNPLRALCAVH